MAITVNISLPGVSSPLTVILPVVGSILNGTEMGP